MVNKWVFLLANFNCSNLLQFDYNFLNNQMSTRLITGKSTDLYNLEGQYFIFSEFF